MTEQVKRRSFWRFGGKYDKAFNWICISFFFLDCFIQVGKFRDYSTGIGIALGQTFVVVILLFMLFKLIAPKQ